MKKVILLTLLLVNLSCFQPQKFEANVPVEIAENNQNTSQVIAMPTDALIFIMSEKGEVFLQNGMNLIGKTSEEEKLQQKFSELLKEKKDKSVFLQVPRSVKYGEVKKVTELLKSAGAEPIGLQIKD